MASPSPPLSTICQTDPSRCQLSRLSTSEEASLAIVQVLTLLVRWDRTQSCASSAFSLYPARQITLQVAITQITLSSSEYIVFLHGILPTCGHITVGYCFPSEQQSQARSSSGSTSIREGLARYFQPAVKTADAVSPGLVPAVSG